MTLIKEKDLGNGVVGDCWKIIQENNNTNQDDYVVELQLYARDGQGERYPKPLGESIRFMFTSDDHYYGDFDLDTIDDNRLTGMINDLETHCRYQHIKNVAQIARAKQDVIDASDDPESEPQLTGNESRALFFSDAIDG